MERLRTKDVVAMHLPEIKEWRETGWSLERIAHRLGLAPSSLGRVVKLYPELTPEKGPTLHSLVMRDVAKIEALRAERMSWAEIAMKLEMPSSGDRLREMYYSVLGYLRSRERKPQVDPANVPFITHQKYR